MKKIKIKVDDIRRTVKVDFQEKNGNITHTIDYLWNVIKYYNIPNLNYKDFIGVNCISIHPGNNDIFMLSGYTREKGLFCEMY